MKQFIQNIQFGDDCKPHNKSFIRFDVDPFPLPEGTVLAQDSEGVVLIAVDSNPDYNRTLISKNYDPRTLQHVATEGNAFVINYAMFNSDGTKLLTASNKGLTTAGIDTYDLSTPWDTSTATHVATFEPPQIDSVTADEIPFATIVGSNDQTLYVYIRESDDGTCILYRYDLSASFDISAPSLQESEDVERPALDGFAFFDDLKFNADGTKAYFSIRDGGTDIVREHSLSTPWVLSSRTLQHTLTEADVPGGISGNGSAVIEFFDDGNKFFVHTSNPETIIYTLGTPYDLSTITDTDLDPDFTAEAPQLRSLTETPLIEDFPVSPEYMELKEASKTTTTITVDINYYNLDDIIELKAYVAGNLVEDEIRADSDQYTFTGLNSGTAYGLKIEAITYGDVISLQDSITITTN